MTDLLTFTSWGEADTGLIAARLAPLLVPGDVVLLEGTLGAGKSAFCRALIRAIARHPEEEVPSPTFTLVQVYDHLDLPVWHFDLYRLSEPDEIIELGWEDGLEEAVLLVEWPDRLEDLRPETALELRIDLAINDKAEEYRVFTFQGPADIWQSRLSSLKTMCQELSGPSALTATD